MKKLTTTTLVIFCSFIFIFALAGCGGKNGGETPASESTSPPAETFGLEEDND